ncbi:uncharacterized protein LOC121736980 [Aricia agestis]|uniref:uncharacterized protein LOC121736980 n=1 Tax=Aricia agestis TaxID=91739 RepID=UPI001C2062B0|nr:uncharacterized protein LOC121736980 [Aricia agestis]
MLRRLYHCSCVQYSSKKQGLKLAKMLNPKHKKQFYPVHSIESNAMPSIKSLTKTEKEPGKRGIRRMAMLNKLFMKNVTDIMSTGTVSVNIVGRGIEISKVKVTPDFKNVNVFWVCKGDSTDEETQILLNSIAGPLRHELSTLRLMGQVPYISFLKDKQEALLVDIDRRLMEADYGEDYTPTELGHLLKADFVLNTKLSPEVKAKIKQLEDQEPIEEKPIPEITHNVYGLEHEKIMNRLLAARKKTKDAWTNLTAADSNVISYTRTLDSKKQDIDTGKQKRELAEFLLKRQIEQKKLAKASRDRLTTVQAIYQDEKDAEEDIIYEDDYEEEDIPFYEHDMRNEKI